MHGYDGPPKVLRYPREAISTFEVIPRASPIAKVLDFGDFPCPPPRIADQLEPGKRYNPILISPDSFPIGNQSCHVAGIRDPPTRAFRVGDITGPEDDSGVIPG